MTLKINRKWISNDENKFEILKAEYEALESEYREHVKISMAQGNIDRINIVTLSGRLSLVESKLAQRKQNYDTDYNDLKKQISFHSTEAAKYRENFIRLRADILKVIDTYDQQVSHELYRTNYTPLVNSFLDLRDLKKKWLKQL